MRASMSATFAVALARTSAFLAAAFRRRASSPLTSARVNPSSFARRMNRRTATASSPYWR